MHTLKWCVLLAIAIQMSNVRAVYADSGLSAEVLNYVVRYEYDQMGRIVRTRLIGPVSRREWRIEYSYTSQLDGAKVLNDAGATIRQYRYIRDPNDRISRKTILSTTNVLLGTVEVRYGADGKISEILINTPADLPPWDPNVEK